MQNQRSKIKAPNYSFKLKISKTFAFLFIALHFVLCTLYFVTPAHAQLSSIGVATYLPISNSKVEDGDIVVTSDKGYSLSKEPYDPTIVGVVSINPAISIKTTGAKKGYPVISTGNVYVKVTDINGNIKRGDFITSSGIPGTGMKSVESGYVLGQSLENVKFSKKGEIKFMELAISPHFVQLGSSLNNSLFDIFKLSKVAAYEKPSKVLQYVVAAIITIATFACGFVIFAKTVNTGLEALGRNPLAGRMIQLSIAFNVLLITVIIIGGIALAYLVIRL